MKIQITTWTPIPFQVTFGVQKNGVQRLFRQKVQDLYIPDATMIPGAESLLAMVPDVYGFSDT